MYLDFTYTLITTNLATSFESSLPGEVVSVVKIEKIPN